MPADLGQCCCSTCCRAHVHMQHGKGASASLEGPQAGLRPDTAVLRASSNTHASVMPAIELLFCTFSSAGVPNNRHFGTNTDMRKQPAHATVMRSASASTTANTMPTMVPVDRPPPPPLDAGMAVPGGGGGALQTLSWMKGVKTALESRMNPQEWDIRSHEPARFHIRVMRVLGCEQQGLLGVMHSEALTRQW